MSLSSGRRDRPAAEILKARDIRRVVYFHSDHFEPWRYVPGRPANFDLALEDLDQYLRATQERDFARCATLFFKPNSNNVVSVDRNLWRADPADRVGFVPPTAAIDKIATAMFTRLREAGRELQLHIHHENVTWNDRMRDEAMRIYLEDPANRRFDEARFELLLRLCLDQMAQHGVIDPKKWLFVHGHWALNASDPHECTLVREIEILRRNGCLGDFTQPSGRAHTNSRLEEPHLVRPVPLAKGYDRPEADPVAFAGAGTVPADRFMIWASEVNHRFTSIDHYSGFVQERIKDPQIFARANAAQGFAHDGVLYVKTHAHTMQPIYWQEEGCGPFPHAHPGIVAELGALFDAADEAGAEVEFTTASGVFDALLAAPSAPARDLVSLHRLSEGDPMTEVGCDIVFRDTQGEAQPAPALDPAAPIPPLAPSHPVPPPAALVWPTIEERRPAKANGEVPPPIPLMSDPVMAGIGAALAGVAESVLLSRGEASLSAPGPEGTAPLAAEMHLARTLEGAGPNPEAPLVEIGCGTGLLSTLLAARGWTVVGLDRRPKRLETARAIADAAVAAGLVKHAPHFEEATFPDWKPGRWPAGDAIAIVPRIANEGGLSGQAAFIRGLTIFDGVLIDLRHFFVERTTAAEQQRLVELFANAGFDAPRVVEEEGPNRLALFHHARPGGLSGWAGRMLRGLGLGRAA